MFLLAYYVYKITNISIYPGQTKQITILRKKLDPHYNNACNCAWMCHGTTVTRIFQQKYTYFVWEQFKYSVESNDCMCFYNGETQFWLNLSEFKGRKFYFMWLGQALSPTLHYITFIYEYLYSLLFLYSWYTPLNGNQQVTARYTYITKN